MIVSLIIILKMMYKTSTIIHIICNFTTGNHLFYIFFFHFSLKPVEEHNHLTFHILLVHIIYETNTHVSIGTSSYI